MPLVYNGEFSIFNIIPIVYKVYLGIMSVVCNGNYSMWNLMILVYNSLFSIANLVPLVYNGHSSIDNLIPLVYNVQSSIGNLIPAIYNGKYQHIQAWRHDVPYCYSILIYSIAFSIGHFNSNFYRKPGVSFLGAISRSNLMPSLQYSRLSNWEN